MSIASVAGQPAAAAHPAGPRRLHNLRVAILANRKAAAGLALLTFFFLVAVAGPLLVRTDPNAQIYGQLEGPSSAHWLGTTAYGQDIFAQLVWGTRETLVIAIVAGLGATVVAMLVGVASAYLGGITDHTLSLITDMFLVIPALPLMIVIAAYAKSGGLAVLITVLVVTGWSYCARQLRSQALSLRNRDFLEAARVRGERSWYVILVEILPTMTSLLVATFLGAALYSVLAAAGLQFIGLGDANELSWGTMLYWAENNEALSAGAPLWALAPGVCIALLGAAFALLNYAFDEVGNPALRPVRRRSR